MKSKSIWLGIGMVAHGLFPAIAAGDPSAAEWVQVETGLGIIFLRLGIKKAEKPE